MPGMRGLTIVVVGADPARWSAALALASAQAALGGGARIYCRDAAVTRLTPSPEFAVAQDLGVTFTACQSGLAAHDQPLPEGVEAGGLVSLLAALGDDRLVTL